ncbi:Ig-like domain-containing protein [Pedomonas mirosovicensis]|uniref:Ig-like domain-containing protein n=1 Tax=Pedomonas mirosovicensis TaxID=2908641 RepID=UPI002167ED0A|nr:Ig-like domain-containing protein [Pedomonas mirosovicensis]MCH8684295.1 Ig-like domain-containing protein [Pedomonas mirosovicensis]
MTALALDSLIPAWALWLLVVLLALPGLVALWRRRWLTGAARLLVAVIAFAILARPITRIEERRAEPDIAVAVVDTSDSMNIGNRRAEAAAALKALREASGPDLRWRVVETEGRPLANGGTGLMDEIGRAIGQTSADRLAGAVVISDGIVGKEQPPVLPEGKPVHVLLAGDRNMVDRRMVVEASPPYAVVGQIAHVTVRVEGGPAGLPVNWSIDGQPQQPVATDAKGRARLAIKMARRGPAIVTASVPPAPGEQVIANNAALVRLNGVRDRLAVLLVSGAPSLSTRMWRDILTLDAALDTVHFTILRLPSSFDPTPTEELSLIPFPVEQLFEQRLRRFDLIVLDRFDQLDLLSPAYFDAISDYVMGGGALLVVTGPEHQAPFGLSSTSVGRMLPARPTGFWETTPYRAAVTSEGKRHPITATLEEEWGLGRPWGRWRTRLPATATRGHTLLSGPGNAPLLVIDRQGRGRVGVLLALDVWRWGRGVDGGGPRDALLTRLVHWLMQEPDLEEEQLSARGVGGDRLEVTVRSMAEPEPVTITPPQGAPQRLDPKVDAQGLAHLTVPAPVPGLYRIESGKRRTFALVGAGPERQEVRPRPEPLASLAKATGGGVFWLADGTPSLRRLEAGRPQAGGSWLGLIRNGGGALLGVREEPLIPPLVLWSLLAVALGVAWVAERRR